MKPRIGSAADDEFAMPAGFDDASGIEHDDLIRVAHSTEAMRDHDRHTAFHELAQAGLDGPFTS